MSHFDAITNVHHDFSVYTYALFTAIKILVIGIQCFCLFGIFAATVNTLDRRNWKLRIRRCFHLSKNRPWITHYQYDIISTYVPPLRWLSKWV